MNDHDSNLEELLVHDLPVLFGESLLAQMKLVYAEAHASVYENPALGEAEAEYLLGHQRRALAETVLRNIAIEHRLQVSMIEPDNGGCKSVYVTSTKFGFTMCHVQSGCQFPKHSDTRAQSALINKYIRQRSLFPIDSETGVQKIYGILIHTELSEAKDELGSMHIGFPNPDFSGWIDIPIDILDIIDKQKQRFQKPADLQGQIQQPKPTFKERKDLKPVSRDDK